MNISTAKDRLRRITVVTILLVLLGAGSAAAYWTAQARVEARATAASVGLDQTLLLADGASPLAGTYSTENLTLAGAVSIKNTGSREATYTLAVRPGPATSPSLPAALRITAAPVASALECGPQATLTGASGGMLEAGFSLDGALDAGATVTVCVQSSLAAADHDTLADGKLELTMTSSLEYAKAAQWQIQADQAMTAAQTVEAAPPLEDEFDEMFCRTDGPWEPQLVFTGEEGQQARDAVKYRMFIAHAKTPATRTPFAYAPTTGGYPVVHLSNTAPEVKALTATEAGGYGNAWLYVEKRFNGQGEWVPAAQGKFHTTATTPYDSNATGVYCGWQK